jgi:ATP-binding protein involved in chromosome partitioning
MKARNIEDIQHKIVVMSGKGGVGKSTVATSLAVSLAKGGARVGLLDCDIHGPTIPKLLGIEDGKVSSSALGLQPVTGPFDLKVMSMGFLLSDPDCPIIWRGPAKMSVIRQFLEEIFWGKLDYLVIDLPPGTGDEPLTIAQLIPGIDGAIIVTTPQEVALLSVRKSIKFAEALRIPIIGMVENMSGFKCPHCSAETDIFGSGGGQRAAQEMNVAFLGKLPCDPKIIEGGDHGKAFIPECASPGTAESWISIVKKVEDFVEKEGGFGMKIVVPSMKPGGLDADVSAHFGHCEVFTLVELDGKKVKKASTIENPEEHDCMVPVEVLLKKGVKTVLIGGIGRNPLLGMQNVGIAVYIGASGKVKDAISDYQEGHLRLAKADDICHGCHPG